MIVPKNEIFMCRKWIFLAVILTFLTASPLVHAACTSPPGSDESFEWDETTHTWTYCDGTTWKNLRELDDSGSGVRTRLQIANDTGSCTAAKLGRLRYDGTATWEYCDGSAWLPFEATGCPTTPTTTGLVAHWKLDEITGTTLADEMGNYDATYQDTPLASGGSNMGNSMQVYATDRYASAGSISEINNASAITITAWMRRWENNDVLTIGKDIGHSDATGIEIWSDGKVYFEVYDGGATQHYGEITLNDAAWHHYAMVFDGTLSGNSNRLKVYVDKTLQSLTFNGTIPATTASAADAFTMGEDADAGGGYIDEVRVYDRALNATEIQEIYDYNNAGCD